MSDITFKPGDVVGGYEVLSFPARGGMGAVYKVRNRVTGEIRALKLMLGSLASDPEMLRRFRREARTAARLRHPHLVEVHEPGMHGSQMFLPMEFLQGETLADVLTREGSLSLDETLRYLLPVLSAVEHLHANGLIHRDIKPGNIFLARNPRGVIVPRLIDLGAARARNGSDSFTAAGTVIGTVAYMAPEQARGERDIDTRADQYSLGVIFYQCLTGRRPHERDDNSSILAKRLRGESFPRLRTIAPEVPQAIAHVIEQSLGHHRDARYAAVEDMSRALESARAQLDLESATEISAVLEDDNAKTLRARRPPSVTPSEVSAHTSLSRVFPRSNGLRTAAIGVLTGVLLVMGARSAIAFTTRPLSPAAMEAHITLPVETHEPVLRSEPHSIRLPVQHATNASSLRRSAR